MGFRPIMLGRTKAQIECCHHCTKREVGCHSWCVEYNLERRVLREANNKAKAEYKKEYIQENIEVKRSLAKKKIYANKTRK